MSLFYLLRLDNQFRFIQTPTFESNYKPERVLEKWKTQNGWDAAKTVLLTNTQPREYYNARTGKYHSLGELTITYLSNARWKEFFYETGERVINERYDIDTDYTAVIREVLIAIICRDQNRLWTIYPDVQRVDVKFASWYYRQLVQIQLHQGCKKYPHPCDRMLS